MYTFFVWHVLQPYSLLLVGTLVGILVLWLRRRETRLRLLPATIGILALTLVSLPPVGYALRGSLEWLHPPLAQRPGDAGAVVVLGGGLYPADEVRIVPELDADSQYRCAKGAEMYFDGPPCPIVVSGGKDPEAEGPACAELMRDFLVRLGVPARDIIVEAKSRTTYENAVESQQLLAHRNIDRVVLVTTATHLDRSWRCFRKLGVDAVPCGCQYRATPSNTSRTRFWPEDRALHESALVLHEWLGMLWYWLRGRI